MVYNYTKPRGPIAAMYSSPGPCYGLPGLVGSSDHDPRSVHYKGPAYHFGIRHGKTTNDSSPGPCYNPKANMYRDGWDTGRAFSLYSRKKDGQVFQAPGPGAYKAEHDSACYRRAPGYSFGVQHRRDRSDQTPGPNNYKLNDMLGRTVESKVRSAPCHSITGKAKTGGFSEDLQKTPGPGAYSVTAPWVYKGKPPAYSMTSRNPMPGDSTKKPGPGTYKINYKLYRRCGDGFSFRIRHSQYKGEFITDSDLDC